MSSFYLVGLSGVDLKILGLAASKFGFRVDFHRETSWIDFVNGSWIGTVASVGKGQSDIGIGNVALSYQMVLVSGRVTRSRHWHISKSQRGGQSKSQRVQVGYFATFWVGWKEGWVFRVGCQT